MPLDSSSRVTLRDIAQKLGFAHSTVSEALRDSPRVSPGIRRQIQQVARKMGYQPNPMAVALGQQRHQATAHPISAGIAWLNYWRDPAELRGYKEFDLYWTGACEAARRCGYRLEEFAGHGRLSSSRLEGILKARNIRAILIPPHRPEDLPAGWERIRWEEFSVIRLGYSVKFPPAHIVAANQLASGVIAFDNMRRLGYRRIGYIHEARTSRLPRSGAGFLMQLADLAPEQGNLVLTLPAPPDRSDTQALLAAWLARHRPEAVFTDIAALRGMIEAAGLRVPQDIGLAGMSVLDGNTDAGIRQHSGQIGRVAVEMLVSLVNQNSRGIPSICRETLIESHWVDGVTLPDRRPVVAEGISS